MLLEDMYMQWLTPISFYFVESSLYKFLLYFILSFLFLFITLLDYIILLGSIYYFNELNRKIEVGMFFFLIQDRISILA